MHAPLRIAPLVAVSAALLFSYVPAHASAPPDEASKTDHEAKVDDSKVNVRDRQHQEILPTDQPNNSRDIDVAAAVRRAITKDDSLSTMAHNVKLVASAGVVTLRGPVASASEKAKVEALTANTPGVTSVQNDLDIKH